MTPPAAAHAGWHVGGEWTPFREDMRHGHSLKASFPVFRTVREETTDNVTSRIRPNPEI